MVISVLVYVTIQRGFGMVWCREYMDTSLSFRGLYINKYAALVAMLQIIFQVLANMQKDLRELATVGKIEANSYQMEPSQSFHI